jgi:uncharacterized membrane protein YccC
VSILGPVGAVSGRSLSFSLSPLTGLRSIGPATLFGLRLSASVSLALYIAFWLQLDNPFWAGTSAAIVCQPQLGASLRKGWFRMMGTLIGAVMSVALSGCFAQNRMLFLGVLAFWGAVCACVATLLRNFASYAAALSGYTVAIIAGDLLGATGGVDANAAFLLAVTRASEISLGIACAGIILAATDLGGARRQLATSVADLAAQISGGFARSLAARTLQLPFAQSTGQDLVSRVIVLDPIIDQTLGESSQIRYYSPVLQRAVDGLFDALAAWHAAANHLVRLPRVDAQQEGAAVLENVPRELKSVMVPPAQWLSSPVLLYESCETTVRRFGSLSAGTVSQRLLAERAAEVFGGLSCVFAGLALLTGGPARAPFRRGAKRVRVPDWLPALINAGRAFVTIGTVALFWIVTGWPGGPEAITFATVVALLLAPRADQAYGAAIIFTVGILIDVVLTAIVGFDVLPRLGTETFATLSLVIGFCLVPMGALLAQARQPWQVGLFTAMTMIFLPLLQPTNPMIFNAAAFYNTALTIVGGAGFAALSFRLVPPLSPAYRAHRLLKLTLRDLQRLASGLAQTDWEGHIDGRLSAMPANTAQLQRAQLLAARSAGSEIIRLRQIARQLAISADLDTSLASIARADTAGAIANLQRLDAALQAQRDSRPNTQTILRARASILALSEVLARHAAYFDAGAPP